MYFFSIISVFFIMTFIPDSSLDIKSICLNNKQLTICNSNTIWGKLRACLWTVIFYSQDVTQCVRLYELLTNQLYKRFLCSAFWLIFHSNHCINNASSSIPHLFCFWTGFLPHKTIVSTTSKRSLLYSCLENLRPI